MSFPARFEKLKFIVDELQLALHLARYAPDDFVARSLSRHVAIRANDFIDHARRLRKPLNEAGCNTREFNKTKEVYAQYFDEYFHVVRDKLGAHVQDFDFGQRIELWNNIEVVKIEYFVESARQIYDGLAPLSIPGYVPRVEPAELTDVGLTGVLESFKGSGEDRLWAELGLDPLAMTRPTSTSTLGMSPDQSRAGQLVLIRRWIKSQRELISRVQSYDRVVRILKSRLITDIVSFFDGLVTRPVTVGAPQRMDGLNTLLANMGQGPSAIDRFLGVFNHEAVLRSGREVRDRIGAHLEVDQTVPLSTLFNEIDSLELQTFLAFFERLAQVFEQVCFEVPFLRLYVADGRRLYGVMPRTSLATQFDRCPIQTDDSRRSLPDYNNEQAYQDNLTKWLRGDAATQEDARYYFYETFLHSETIEPITEREKFGSAWRLRDHQMRKAHQFIANALRSNDSEDFFQRIFDLLVRCRTGDPYILSEIVMKCSGIAPGRHEIRICWCLGELASSPHKTVSEYLAKCAEMTQHWDLRFQAVLALFKIYMESEGLTRINKKVRIRTYSKDIAPLILNMTEDQRLLCVIAFASQFHSPRFGIFAQPLSDDYSLLQSEIDLLCEGELLGPICAPVTDLLHQLISTFDYVGVCLLLADQLKAASLEALGDALLTFACAGCVVTAPHNQAIRHLAVCLLRKREFARALEIADQLATRNPSDVMLQVFLAQLLAITPGAGAEALGRISMIRAQYKLTTTDNNALLELERRVRTTA